MSPRRLIQAGVILALLFLQPVPAQPDIVTGDFNVSPPGRLVDIGGYRLHLHCLGRDGPVVVFESGAGGFSLEWLEIQEALAAEAVVCAYDRAGYGWSEAGPMPRTTARLGSELHALLERAGLPGPYYLVGHSFGGYVVQYYARRYSDEVAAVMLIDASHPEQVQRLPRPANRDHPDAIRLPPRMAYMFSQPAVHPDYPKQYADMALQLSSNWKSMLARREELVNFRFSGQQVLNAGPFPRVPLVVLTRGLRVFPHNDYGDAMELTWMILQGELSQLTPDAVHLVADCAGHVIHLEQPEVVIAAVRNMIAGAAMQSTIVANHTPERSVCGTDRAGLSPGK